MVRALHRAGIEVILDVVYNHTAEGNHLGPTLSIRGIDNAAYYRLVDDNPAYYMDYTGTGNTLQHAAPARAAARDGLAALLGRGDARRRVPLRSRVDARARPARGRSPRRVLRPHPAGPGRVAREADRRAVGRRRGRLPGRQLPAAVVRSGTASTATGSATTGAASRARCPSSARGSPVELDLYQSRRAVPARVDQLRHRARRLHAARPGLVQREAQRGERRGQPRRREPQPSWNCGAEGPTDDPAINALRARQQRNFLATLFLSQGVPMLLGGDELGRTQQRQQQRVLPGQRAVVVRLGDTPIASCSSSCSGSSALRREHPVFRRRGWFQGRPIRRAQGRQGAARHRVARPRRRAR